MKGAVNPKKFSNPQNFQVLNFSNPKIKRVVNPKIFQAPTLTPKPNT